MKYFDYFFKTAIIIICVVFLVLFYNFTKLKYFKVMVIGNPGNQYEITMDNLNAEQDYAKKISPKPEGGRPLKSYPSTWQL
jgi:hypothetical protein